MSPENPHRDLAFDDSQETPLTLDELLEDVAQWGSHRDYWRKQLLQAQTPQDVADINTHVYASEYSLEFAKWRVKKLMADETAQLRAIVQRVQAAHPVQEGHGD